MRARIVVGERERQHDGQPEDRTDDDKLGALGTIAGVHEVKNNKGGFDRGNDQSDDDIELMKFWKAAQTVIPVPSIKAAKMAM